MAMTDPGTKTIDLAMIDPSIGEPPLNWPADVDPDQISLHYDRDLDTLYLDLFGHALPAVNVPLDTDEVGYVDVRVGIETNMVVGIEVAAYQSLAIIRHPRWGELAEFIGIAPPASSEQEDGSAQSPERITRRRAALETVLADVSAIPVYDDGESAIPK